MSNEVIWNKAMRISYPGGVHVMDETERGKLHFIGSGSGAALSDPDRHMILSVGWKPVNPLLSMLVGAKDAAVNMEKQIRGPMEPLRPGQLPDHSAAMPLKTRISFSPALTRSSPMIVPSWQP